MGKAGQGRAVPVEATLRKGKGSIGAHGPESKEARKRKEEMERGGGADADDDGQVYESQWKKNVREFGFLFNFPFSLINFGFFFLEKGKETSI